jgi:hypothetical protein
LRSVLDLPLLADEIADGRDRRVFAADRACVLDGEGARATEPSADASVHYGAGQDDDNVGTEILGLPAHGLVGALPDRHHHDQRGDADEDAEHRQGQRIKLRWIACEAAPAIIVPNAQKPAAPPVAGRASPIARNEA